MYLLFLEFELLSRIFSDELFPAVGDRVFSSPKSSVTHVRFPRSIQFFSPFCAPRVCDNYYCVRGPLKPFHISRGPFPLVFDARRQFYDDCFRSVLRPFPYSVNIEQYLRTVSIFVRTKIHFVHHKFLMYTSKIKVCTNFVVKKSFYPL